MIGGIFVNKITSLMSAPHEIDV